MGGSALCVRADLMLGVVVVGIACFMIIDT